MRPSSTKDSRITKQSGSALNAGQKKVRKNYLQLSNQQFLRRNLMLLGSSQTEFQKQTKLSIQSEYFPKNQVNPTSTKQFFYITYFCLDKLCSNEELTNIRMWYPPRTVNEQLQFKKVLYKLLTNLEILGKLPKNFVVSKAAIMGDCTHQTLVQFLRFLSQMALRHQYIQLYSQKDKLIQIRCNNSSNLPQNDINRFYIHPFVPSSSSTSFDHPSLELSQLAQTYHNYIKIYLKKLIKLKTTNFNPVLAELHQNLMKNYMEQKQISQTLAKKIPAPLLGENRAFDRRRLIDRNLDIWQEIQKLECHFMEEQRVPVLKVEGEIDQILQKWQPVKGISNLLEANQILKINSKMKKQLDECIINFRELCTKIESQIKN